MSKADEYRNARLACEIARNVLQGHDLSGLLRDIDRADAVGPLLNPTLWQQKHSAMAEDRAVFEAAMRFLSVWPKDGGTDGE